MLTAAFSVPRAAAGAEVDALLERLQATDVPEWETIEDQIWQEWSKSGSPAMDLLLKRGRDAMTEGDFAAAVEHFTALTDHAPDFAEGWNARATAYFSLKLYGPSIADIQRTLTLNPRHFGALNGLGLMLEELGYAADALRAYRAAAKLHPHRPELKEAIKRLDLRVEGIDL